MQKSARIRRACLGTVAATEANVSQRSWEPDLFSQWWLTDFFGAQVDPNAARNHPDWDAPLEKMQEAVRPPPLSSQPICHM